MSFRARPAAICHSEPRPMVECEQSPPSYSKRWRLYSRLAGDASLSLSMTYAWGEILRCSTPRNDKQMSFRTYVRNPRLFVWDSSFRLRCIQNDITPWRLHRLVMSSRTHVRDLIQNRLDGDASLRSAWQPQNGKATKNGTVYDRPILSEESIFDSFIYFLITFSTSTVPSLYVVRTKFKPGASSLCTAPLIE